MLIRYFRFEHQMGYNKFFPLLSTSSRYGKVEKILNCCKVEIWFEVFR